MATAEKRSLVGGALGSGGGGGGGMVKKEQPAWQDTNMALFGSDLEKNIKKAAAETEEQWDGVGEREELRIWRIEQFKVVKWAKSSYGRFHEGDSYIILKVTEKPREDLEGLKGAKDRDDEFLWDIHFWIGRSSTQDEYGTAAYKTVELDAILDDKATQHRETQGNESELFKSYFRGHVDYLPGGTKTGFNSIADIVHVPVLYRIKGVGGRMLISEEELTAKSLCSGEAFILDASESDRPIYVWYGSDCNTTEKRKAEEFAKSLKGIRSKSDIAYIEEGDTEDEIRASDTEHATFWEIIGGRTKGCLQGHASKVKTTAEGGHDALVWQPQLYRVTDEASCFKKAGPRMSRAEQGTLTRDMFKADDVYIFDPGYQIFVWIGNNASSVETRQSMVFAQQYLTENKRPKNLVITQIKQRNETGYFKGCIAGTKEKKAPSICLGAGCAITTGV